MSPLIRSTWALAADSLALAFWTSCQLGYWSAYAGAATDPATATATTTASLARILVTPRRTPELPLLARRLSIVSCRFVTSYRSRQYLLSHQSRRHRSQL